MVEWTAGPIPWNMGKAPLDPEAPKDPEEEDGTRGKELVMKFTSGLHSDGKFYADSNGREMIKRTRNGRLVHKQSVVVCGAWACTV